MGTIELKLLSHIKELAQKQISLDIAVLLQASVLVKDKSPKPF
jgi:hypothetical protein